MRILLVTNLLPPDYEGGYELNAWKLAVALRERGHNVQVVTSKYRKKHRGERPDFDWVHRILEFRPYQDPLLGKLGRYWAFAWWQAVELRNVPAMQKYLAPEQFDVAYVFGVHDVGMGILNLIQDRGIPILWHLGDYIYPEQRKRFDDSKFKQILASTVLKGVKARAAALRLENAAFISKYLQEEFEARGEKAGKSYVIPRGIEFELHRDVDRLRIAPPAFTVAGRLVPDKGFHVAIQAARDLLKRRPDLNWQLQLVGSGNPIYEESLKKTIAVDPELQRRVHFLGRKTRAQVVEIFKASTAFISASTWEEPFGNTNIEAMAAGTPIIASKSGGILEIVENERTALVYPKESWEQLSLAMERILTEEGLSRKLALNALKDVEERFAFSKIFDRTEAVLREVAGHPVGEKKAA
ncbi:MAG TPA: glycosyltransferase family 4 protein [Fimbriimonas sp.]|nr:glycosyltransferase family 4 protein [Fimbriimonas sp.]